MTSTDPSVISITLPEPTRSLLKKRADASGVDMAELAGQMIQDALQPRTIPAGADLDAILRSVRDRFDASGMTDDDLDALVDETREELRRGQRNEIPRRHFF